MVEWMSPDPIDQMTPSLIWHVCGCCVGHSPPGPCESFVAITGGDLLMTARMEVCASLALGMMSQAMPRARMVAPEFGGQRRPELHGSLTFPFLGVCGGRIRLLPKHSGCTADCLWVITNMEISWLKNLRLLLFQPEKHTSN